MTAKDQLQSMLAIQEIALRIRASQQVVDEAPGHIERIEEAFRERNAEFVALRERHDELKHDERLRTGELATLVEKRKKFMDDLMQVKNQREYAAMLKEIDTVKAEISEHEDAVLKDLGEIENLKEQLAAFEEHIAKEREAVAAERARVESDAEHARQAIERHRAERGKIESTLSAPLLVSIRQLETSRQGIFLTRAEDGTCQSCYVRLRPQVFQEIRLASALHACGSCRRFLYFPSSLRPAPDNANAGDKPRGEGIEALNGGAV